MQNMQTWTSVAAVWPLYSSSTETKAHGATRVLLHPHDPCIGLAFNRKSEAICSARYYQFGAESTFGDSRWADEHPVLAVGQLQYLCHSVVSSANMKCASDQDVLHAQSGWYKGLYKG